MYSKNEVNTLLHLNNECEYQNNELPQFFSRISAGVVNSRGADSKGEIMTSINAYF